MSKFLKKCHIVRYTIHYMGAELDLHTQFVFYFKIPCYKGNSPYLSSNSPEGRNVNGTKMRLITQKNDLCLALEHVKD